jgi:hypothetical protein
MEEVPLEKAVDLVVVMELSCRGMHTEPLGEDNLLVDCDQPHSRGCLERVGYKYLP